jgi:hypothetical protein
MRYIKKTATASGAYPPPQSLKAKGLLNFPLEFLEEFNSYNGFVTLTVEGDTVTGITPNVEAWEAWKANKQDEPQTPTTENSVYDELAEAYRQGVQEA